jgi:hypothetical protein
MPLRARMLEVSPPSEGISMTFAFAWRPWRLRRASGALAAQAAPLRLCRNNHRRREFTPDEFMTGD